MTDGRGNCKANGTVHHMHLSTTRCKVPQRRAVKGTYAVRSCRISSFLLRQKGSEKPCDTLLFGRPAARRGYAAAERFALSSLAIVAVRGAACIALSFGLQPELRRAGRDANPSINSVLLQSPLPPSGNESSPPAITPVRKSAGTALNLALQPELRGAGRPSHPATPLALMK